MIAVLTGGRAAATRQAGFTSVDVLIALAILLIGILALVAAVTGAVVRSRLGEQQLLAKQDVSSTLESVISVRDINNQLIGGWSAVANTSNPVLNPDGTVQRGGLFLSGEQPLYKNTNGQELGFNRGKDRILGTKDDACDMEGLKEGVDATLPGEATAGDCQGQPAEVVPGYTRRIQIDDLVEADVPVGSPVMLRKVEVETRYNLGGVPLTEHAEVFITNTNATRGVAKYTTPTPLTPTPTWTPTETWTPFEQPTATWTPTATATWTPTNTGTPTWTPT